jgi:hypothetical protein
LLTLVLDPARCCELSPLARRLHALACGEGSIRLDQAPANTIDSLRERSRATRELEERLLVHTASVHGKAGAHVKVLTSWSHWAKNEAVTPLHERRHALAALRDAVNRLTSDHTRPSVALLDDPSSGAPF